MCGNNVLLDYTARHLVGLDGLEQRPEVAFAKPLVALALDDLEENRTDHGFGENLQQLVFVALLVEPFAQDDVTGNLNPIGRVFYAASTLICTPASLSQEVGAALGAQAGESRLREVAEAAGFSIFRRAAETPFNIVLEGKP